MIKKIIITISLLLTLILTGSGTAFATTHNISDALEISFDGDTIFNDQNMYPGKEISKTITVRNYGKYSHSFSIATSSVSGMLADVIFISPVISGNEIWSKNLTSIAVSPSTDNIISDIAPGQTVDIELKAKMSSGLGNEYMGKALSFFNFYMGNEASDQSENQNDSDTSTDSSGFADYVTLNLFPGNNGTVVGENQTQPTPESTTKPDNKTDELIKTDSNLDNQEVKGAQTGRCFAWLWLILLLIFLIVYKLRYGSKKFNLKQLWPLVAGIVVYLLHYFVDDNQSQLFLCKYFIWLDIVIVLGYYVIESLFNDNQ